MKHKFLILNGLFLFLTTLPSLSAQAAKPISAKTCQLTLLTVSTADSALLPEGAMVILTNIDKRKPVDTAYVRQGKVELDIPKSQDVFALGFEGKKLFEFFADAQQLSLRLGSPVQIISAGSLNPIWFAHNQKVEGIFQEFRKSETSPERRQQLENDYNLACRTLFEQNKQNAIGVAILGELAYDLELPQLDSLMALVPSATSSAQIERLHKSKQIAYQTRPGVKFADFKARNVDNTQDVRLSDIVGKGKYVLADFWATWCGPCRHEFPYIRKAYDTYKNKGLIVLGVNVWDKYPAFREGLGKYDLVWNHIYASADRSATDTYGIAGIPHIILFGPDGTIIARGLRGDEMLETLAKHLGK